MPARRFETTDFLVLRKTPFGETSLVLAGLSPDLGQAHVMLRGARRLGRRDFPLADSFRLLRMQYRPPRGDLLTWADGELVADYARLARLPAGYATASWLARFALQNTHPYSPCPRLFAALVAAVDHLAVCADAPAGTGLPAATSTALRVGVCLVHLDEHGVLPDYAENPRRAELRQTLIAMAEHRQPVPTLTAEQWSRLDEWVKALLRYTGCPLPEPAADWAPPTGPERPASPAPPPAPEPRTEEHDP